VVRLGVLICWSSKCAQLQGHCILQDQISAFRYVPKERYKELQFGKLFLVQWYIDVFSIVMPMTDADFQLSFQSSYFQPIDGEEDQTNPGCLGKALALWLAGQLRQSWSACC
jgi:hypothetical protein